MIKEYPSNSKIIIINGKCEDMEIDSLDFDFVFTSPPFWRKKVMLEKYNYSENDYDYLWKPV